MRYRVTARLLPGRAAALYGVLMDGTVEEQQPDGREILASMKRAKITAADVIEWNEECYCDTPLDHERRTVFDHYFEDLTTALVDEFEDVDGKSFWEYLEREATVARK